MSKLVQDVSQKEEIINIKGTQSETENTEKLKKKMDAVVTRRKLLDLIEAQSEEIDFLR